MTELHGFSFSAGALCLDFANTCGDRPTCAEERLHGARELVSWAVAAGLVDEAEARRFGRELDADPTGATALLDDAITLREAIFETCSSIASGRAPGDDHLEIINQALRQTLPNLRIGVHDGGCCWQWHGASSVRDRVLWPVVRSTADLLTSNAADLIRLCAGDGCSWLFLDSSRNRSRKWCSMASCGNRAKARRHYARKRAMN